MRSYFFNFFEKNLFGLRVLRKTPTSPRAYTPSREHISYNIDKQNRAVEGAKEAANFKGVPKIYRNDLIINISKNRIKFLKILT